MGDTEPGTAWYINYEMLVEEEISVIGEYTSLLRLYIYVYETNIVFDFYVLTHIWIGLPLFSFINLSEIIRLLCYLP